MTGSPPPTSTSYQLVPGFSSCHLVFSYQAPHSVYLNFNLISLTERQGIQIPSLLPGTSFEMGLKRSIREDGCVCLLVGVGGRLSCGWSFFSFLKILGHSQWTFLATSAIWQPGKPPGVGWRGGDVHIQCPWGRNLFLCTSWDGAEGQVRIQCLWGTNPTPFLCTPLMGFPGHSVPRHTETSIRELQGARDAGNS